MQKTGISRERAFAQLRSKGIRHLGEVKRLYFEAGGTFTLMKRYDPVAGLPILPIWDKEYQQEISSETQDWVCENCGQTPAGNSTANKCYNCKETSYVRAVS